MKFTVSALNTWRRLQFAFVLSVLLSSALADDFSITSGLSAHWFNPERSGEGLVLEILSEESALLYWFTYDEEGNQRWLIDVGDIAGDEIIFSELTVTHGGRFGPDFDPDEVEYEVVGQAVLQFSDCDHSEFNYTAFGHSETIPMVRLSQTMAAGCQPINGVPGQPVREYAGQSGSWYDPAHTGEGYTLQWMSRDEALLIWFSYDPVGNQYWMIGTGMYDEGKIEFPMLHATHGGRFGGGFDPEDVQFIEWGTLTLEIDCDSGTAQYVSELSGFGSGGLNLDRLSQMNRPTCPWEPPKFHELYSVTYEELPLRNQSENDNIQPQDVANNGRVAAMDNLPQGINVWTWMPGEPDMTMLPEVLHSSPILIKPDGAEIIAHDRPSPSSDIGWLPMVWDGSTWSPYFEQVESTTFLERFSQDGSQAVGTVRSLADDSRLRVWKTGPDGELIILPVEEGVRTARGYLISNDGKIAIGHQFDSDGTQAFRYTSRWMNGGEPEILRDQFGAALAYPAACNTDCSIITGAYQGGQIDPEHPNIEQAWLWIEPSGVHYLPRIEGAIENAGIPPYGVQDMTADGTMIVGRYLIAFGGILGARAFIWTQSTGMVTIDEIFEANAIGDQEWFRMNWLAISPNGKYILVSGFSLGTPSQPQGPTRAFLLTLDRIEGEM